MKNKISVVLATLGEKNIFEIVKILNQSDIEIEIIIIIPQRKYYKIKELKKNKNIIIIQTDFFSQPKQRIEGFKIAKYDFVLQLDSDVKINKFFLREILDFISLKNSNCAVSLHPIIEHKFKSSIYRNIINCFFYYFIKREKNFNNWDSWFTNNLFKINNGRVKLLTGACILHYKKNLILDDFYNYKYKAYGEDILHSCLLHNKKISFYFKRSKNIKFHLSGGYVFKNIIELNFFIKRMSVIYFKIFLLTNGNLFIFSTWFLFWYLNIYINYFLKKIL